MPFGPRALKVVLVIRLLIPLKACACTKQLFVQESQLKSSCERPSNAYLFHQPHMIEAIQRLHLNVSASRLCHIRLGIGRSEPSMAGLSTPRRRIMD